MWNLKIQTTSNKLTAFCEMKLAIGNFLKELNKNKKQHKNNRLFFCVCKLRKFIVCDDD